MNPNGNPTPLAQARRCDSIDKRLRVLTAIERLERDGEQRYSGSHLTAVGLPVQWTAEHDAELVVLRRADAVRSPSGPARHHDAVARNRATASQSPGESAAPR
ncbi:hypothetical protein ACFV7R_40770 [Streptomyces sp. NPDC059866]|uniref:hypothetical protein n=1 Tax=Streptomyces sp. NPDC059866 TaxID=3346978 RepID=UPI00366884BC